MSTAAQFTNPTDALTAIFAGNATFTLVSKKTGARYTFKVRKPKNDGPPVFFASLLTGANNETDFTYMGIAKKNGVRTTAKSSMTNESTPVKALDWALQNLDAGHMPETMEVWHTGRCMRCGRLLTVPESVASGIGPDCAEKMAAGE